LGEGALVFCACNRSTSFHSPAGSGAFSKQQLPLTLGASESLSSKCFRAAPLRGLLLALPKSNQKARRPTRCSDSLPANQNALCFSPPAGRRELAHPCAQTSAPCSRCRLRCSAPRKAPFIPQTRPSLDCATGFDLARDPAFDLGPPLSRREQGGKSDRRARTMRARSRTYTDVRQANPALRSRTRSEAQSATSGAASLWLLSLGCRRESDPLATGEWKLCSLKAEHKRGRSCAG